MALIKKIINALKIKSLDLIIYKLIPENFTCKKIDFDFNLKISENKSKKIYLLFDNQDLVHRSVIFKKVGLLKAINNKGYVIGDCFTNINYRGKGIYPKMLNLIGQDYLNNEINLFIVVDRKNLSSIKGIEKSGFSFHKNLKTKRFLNFFMNKKIS